MRLIRIDDSQAADAAVLLADFRVTLRGYKGIASEPDVPDALEEMQEYLHKGWPVFAVEDDGALAGYMVLRIEEGVLWVEHLFVRPEYRRQGAASLLFEKAEETARSMGEDTVYNFVHPNNDGMIAFLRAKGYTVLNLIEVRKPYRDETLTETIRVKNNDFDY
ncbi:MAG: GNAT family N-acetyltransferase [Clostridia bacterium]|nr:GNAT family N-acetyltransferase [Clostridia bacterium]